MALKIIKCDHVAGRVLCAKCFEFNIREGRNAASRQPMPLVQFEEVRGGGVML